MVTETFKIIYGLHSFETLFDNLDYFLKEINYIQLINAFFRSNITFE